MKTNQPNQVAEVLCRLCVVNHCSPTAQSQCKVRKEVLTKLTEIVKECINNTTYPVAGSGCRECKACAYEITNNLLEAGFPLNKGGENGK